MRPLCSQPYSNIMWRVSWGVYGTFICGWMHCVLPQCDLYSWMGLTCQVTIFWDKFLSSSSVTGLSCFVLGGFLCTRGGENLMLEGMPLIGRWMNWCKQYLSVYTFLCTRERFYFLCMPFHLEMSRWLHICIHIPVSLLFFDGFLTATLAIDAHHNPIRAHVDPCNQFFTNSEDKDYR